MLTRIVKFCAEHDLLISIRVSLDGIGDIHNQVRNVKRGFDKALPDHRGDAGARGRAPELPVRHRRDDLRRPTSRTRRTSSRGRAPEKLDIVFNMLRFTDNMLGQHGASRRRSASRQREEEFMRQFFLERVQEESVLSRPGVHVPALRRHDRQRLQAHDAVPVPARRACCSTRTATLFYCENSQPLGNVLDDGAEALYFKAEQPRRTATTFEETICPTCLSPCQVNVGAMKQFVPYAKFLVRAYQVKRDPDAPPRDAPSDAVSTPLGSRWVRLAVALGLLIVAALDQPPR